jgi:flagellar hook-length control protein FliK
VSDGGAIKAEQKHPRVSAGRADIRFYSLAFALLSLLSAMIARAILPAQTSDAAVESPHAENPNSAAAPATDFGSLLFMFSAWTPGEPAVSAAQDPAVNQTAEGGDLDAEKFSLQVVLTPAVIALYDQAHEVVARPEEFFAEFSAALDLSPVYSNHSATAQALPFEGRLPETPEEFAALDFAETFDAQSSLSMESFSDVAAEPHSLPVQPGERAVAALTPENDAPEEGVPGPAWSTEPAQSEAPEPILTESNGPAFSDAAPFRGRDLQNKDFGQERSGESETRDGEDRTPAAGRARVDTPRGDEKFALSESSTQDHAAARAEDLLSDDKSILSNGRKEVSTDDPRAQWIAQGASSRGVENARPAGPPPANAFSATIERLAAEISTHIRDNRHEVTMRLEPPELGALRIELSLDGDRLQARLTAEIADARQLIETHLPELRQALQAHKLDLVNVQVDLGGGWAGLGAGLAQDPRQRSQEQADFAALSTVPQTGDGEAKEISPAATVSSGALSVWA